MSGKDDGNGVEFVIACSRKSTLHSRKFYSEIAIKKNLNVNFKLHENWSCHCINTFG